MEKEITLKGGTVCIDNTDEAGNRTLTATLKSGKVVVVKELLAEDTEKAGRLVDGDEKKAMFALISLSTTFDGEPMVQEDIRKIKMKDFGTISDMNAELNF